ncbi:hypothetical protein phiAS5_ORF0265 [Aeromonas phage phiAS5]|uniref:Uncharacterized protein n=1 Tax=Aeromonas phage phiAS5 TaxID=879630 RepID=E1A219_9CAUD|nr:hypothetical protein phiAS5_ORF0265 [Aeromonas phage phiAS5]ADM80108.1 hypothetical protein phiAS5_ORF0265 [Aeromonas phage phiAS5]
MLTTKQLFESQNDHAYNRFLTENTLYDKDTKVTFVNDETSIINAFAFNFLGILGSFNAARQINDQTTIKFIQRYFKTDAQLRISNIDDRNHNISLIVKLMHDKDMFINSAKVNEMTRFLVLCKSGVVNTVDDDIVRAWVANIKNSAIMKADPKLRDVLLKFKNSAISMIDASKEMRRQRNKHTEISTDYWDVSRRIRFKNMDTVTTGTGAGDSQDNDTAIPQTTTGDDTNAVIDVVGDAPVAPEPVAEPVKPGYLTYDHEGGFADAVLSIVGQHIAENKSGISGMNTLDPNTYTSGSDFWPTGFEFELVDPVQEEMFIRYRERFTDVITKLAGYGRQFKLHSSSIDNISFDVTNYKMNEDTFFIKNRSDFINLYKRYGVYGENNPFTGAIELYTVLYAIAGSKVDNKSWLFGFSADDIMYELFGSALGSKMEALSFGMTTDMVITLAIRLDNAPDERRIAMVDGLEVTFISATTSLMSQQGVDMKLNPLFGSESDVFIGTKAITTMVNIFNKECASIYPTIPSLPTWGAGTKPVHQYMNMIRYMARDYITNANFSFIEEYWTKKNYLEDKEFVYEVKQVMNSSPAQMVYTPLRILPSIAIATLAKAMIRYAKLVGDNLPIEALKRSMEKFPEVANEVRDMIIQKIDNPAEVYQAMQLMPAYLESATGNELKNRISYLLTNIKTKDGLRRFVSRSGQCDPHVRVPLLLMSYAKLGNDMESSYIGDFAYDFVNKIDFDDESAAEFMRLEVAHGFKFMNKENLMGIRRRDDKAKAQQTLVDIMFNGMKANPAVANAFYENMDDYYKGKVRTTLTGINFIYKQVHGGPINMFDTPNMARVKKMFEFNEIDPDELVKSAKIRAKKGETFSDYIARVEAAADTNVVVPPPAVVDDNITDEQKYLIGKHLVDNYYAGKHGNTYPLIHKSFTVNMTYPEYNEFLKQQEAEGKLEQIVPCFHGTGGIAANMVLRYGFKIIPSKDKSVVGRMLGDGLYFSNKIDKILQYVSNEGYGRHSGTRGYVFEMESILGERRKDYRSAGVPNPTDHHGVRSPEWAVFDPKKQIKVLKCYEVELNTFSKYKEHQSKMKGSLVESNRMKFGEMLTEAKRASVKDYAIYTFYDGMIPMRKNGVIEYVDPKEFNPATGVELEYGDDSHVTVYVPATRTEYNRYSMCKKIKGKDLEKFLSIACK